MDWKARLILAKISEGLVFREVALAVGISRQAVLKRMKKSPEFAAAVAQARETGKPERPYRLWLTHYRRGLRPPTGRGHGGKPRFSYGRRG
jgi:predicted ArsR family transcriptional regulator